MAVSQPLTLPDKLRSIRQSVDAETGAILFRHPNLQGILRAPTLLCLDIIDPGALGRLLAEPIKEQLPVGLGD